MHADESYAIRPMAVADLGRILAWRNHPDVRRYMVTQHEISADEHRGWFERVSADPKRRLLIVEHAGEPIGFVQFSGVQAGASTVWGFYAAPDAPPGTGSHLGRLALQFAFRSLQVHKVCGEALEGNAASIRFHRKLGFREEGRLREQEHVGGQYHDLICFGLLAHEWPLQATQAEGS